MRKFNRSMVAAPTLLLLAAGCGAIQAPTGVNASTLAIEAATATLDTTTTDQLGARFGSGIAANVWWSIAGGQNDPSLGQGSVSAGGVYTPPALLSRDSVQIQIVASTRGTPAASAT